MKKSYCQNFDWYGTDLQINFIIYFYLTAIRRIRTKRVTYPINPAMIIFQFALCFFYYIIATTTRTPEWTLCIKTCLVARICFFTFIYIWTKDEKYESENISEFILCQWRTPLTFTKTEFNEKLIPKLFLRILSNLLFQMFPKKSYIIEFHNILNVKKLI